MDVEQIEILNKSPLQSWIAGFDNSHLAWGYAEYWQHAVSQSFQPWNALFLEEVRFREKFGLNIVWSDEGAQGEGKSMGALRKKQVIDTVFGVDFNLKKFISHVHFFDQDLEESLSNGIRRTTDILDEQIRSHGIMTRFMEDQLANYEDTFRKPQKNIGFVSPSLRRHEHFFIFETMGDIYVNREGRPTAVEMMLKTKRKSDGMIMPRGILRFKTPEPEVWDAYNQKKDEFIDKMMRKEGGLMERIEKDADRVLSAHKPDFYRILKDGTQVPAGRKTIDLYMYKVLGMRAYTIGGYDLVREEIKRKL